MTGFKKLIKVLIAENSSVAAKVLVDIMKKDPDIVIVGMARDGKEAIELTGKLKPDIITMDIDLPVIDGLEATKQIMAYQPTPILILNSAGFKERLSTVFKAISYGALEIWEKEFIQEDLDRISDDLISKLKFLAAIKVIHHPLAKLESIKKTVQAAYPWTETDKIGGIKFKDRAVAVVTSTGGPGALLRILRVLPKSLPCPIFIVQHISPGFNEGLVEWLNNECEIQVKIPEDKEVIKPAFVYVAPERVHMRVNLEYLIRLSDEPPYNGHKPSGDILFESVGRVYKRGAIGVILTGMGNDGAKGIKMIKENNGSTIAQDEKSSIVFGMPKAAIDMNVIDKVLPIEGIPLEIVRLLKE